MGSLISGLVSGLYVLKNGSMNTGAMKSKTNEKTTAAIVPQIHQVFGARRNTAYSTTKKIVPPIIVNASPINCSLNQAGKVCVASPYRCSRKKCSYTLSGKVK